MSASVYWDQETNKYLPVHTRLYRVAEELKRYLPQGGKVLDIGCSRMTLKNILGDKFEYYGVDIVDNPVSQQYAKFDLSADNFDVFPFKFKFDAIVCSGVFEYIDLVRIKKMLEFFITNTSHQQTVFVFTYTNFKHITRRIIPNHQKWVTILSIKEIKNIFNNFNLQILSSFPSYYKLRPGPLAPGWNENLQKKFKINIPILASVLGKQFIFVCKKK